MADVTNAPQSPFENGNEKAKRVAAMLSPRKKNARTIMQLTKICRRMVQVSKSPSTNMRKSDPGEIARCWLSTGGLPAELQDLASHSVDELRQKIKEAEERSGQNRRRLHVAGERGQVLVAEEVQLEARLEGFQSAKLEADAAMSDGQLPQSIHGHHGELHYPSSASGKQLYRRILCMQKESHRHLEQIGALEKEIDDHEQQTVLAKRTSDKRPSTPGGNAWKKLKEKSAMELIFMDKVNNERLRKIHILNDEVQEAAQHARQAAKSRARERTDLERQLITARHEGKKTVALLREELRALRETNAEMKENLVELRLSRAHHVSAHLDVISDLHRELEASAHGREIEEAEMQNLRSEFAAATADHENAKAAKKLSSRGAASALQMLHRLNSPRPSNVDSDAESEEWDGAADQAAVSGQCPVEKRAATPPDHRIASPMAQDKSVGKWKHAENLLTASAGLKHAKRRARPATPHVYKAVGVVVHTVTEAHAQKEDHLHALMSARKQSVPEAEGWGGAAWAAMDASNMMGDILLKIDEMTRAAAEGTESQVKHESVAGSQARTKRRARPDSSQHKFLP